MPTLDVGPVSGTGLAFAYVMNDLRFAMEADMRSETLVSAAYACGG